MGTSIDKRSAVVPTNLMAVDRRHALKIGAALAGSVLMPEMAWAADCYDLRCVGGNNYITAIKDQDDPVPCNSCTAFAVVAAVEGTYNKTKSLVPNLDLDEMKLFTAGATVPSGGCGTSHWWPKYALEVCKSTGLQGQGSSPVTAVKITDFSNLLRQNLNLTQGEIKTWLQTKGPVVAVMVQYEDFYTWGKIWSEQNPGQPNPYVYEPGKELDICQPTTATVCQCQTTASPATSASSTTARMASRPLKRTPGSPVGGHVVTIVGFDDTTTPKAWICKNSWGSDWNGNGFVLIAQGAPGRPNIPKCYIDEIDVYGINGIA